MDMELIVAEYVKKELENNNNGHGLEHAKRVVQNTKLILKEVECKEYICIIAAYVHDLIDRKVAKDVNKAKVELELFLKHKLKLSQQDTIHVLDVCDSISYSKGLKLRSVEAKVVQDADRLDALGAVGIARTIAYGTSVNRPTYIKGDKSDDTAIGHFHSKLYKLKDLMNFEISREIASEREVIMREFERCYINECN